MKDESYSRILVFIAGLLGAAGVAMAAGAAHGGGAVRLLAPASAMCLVHAPSLIALDARRPRPGMFTLASALLGGGTLLFAGDLATQAMRDERLFPYAAPIGGTLMIVGWAAVALAAFAPARKSRP
ncbi:DUF423 domain-containing protein [Pararhizobium mangrovi]|uniref:DUF423 domain-containing protein n=1 Tax=Pararhizobium mangrovi TaxID=2590452 RepID=A0A506TW21_9HYPH|nr:DUF423 domain-containing protein [Pararhizobium mangrovi]TPW26273.1 DUF423 domain-containing protein [Pararhizobium mangrovi]